MKNTTHTLPGGTLTRRIVSKVFAPLGVRLYWRRARRTGDVLHPSNTSSVFHWLSYNERRPVVTGQFTDGSRYQWSVPPAVAKAWFTSASAGAFFNRSVRGTS